MKEWWIHLGLREKQILSLGGILVLLFLIYEILLAPIDHHNATLRDEITHDIKLLSWMQEADKHIQSTEKLLHKNSNTKNSAALLSTLQKDITQSPFASNLSQLSQAENNSVQITLQKVNFDALVTWLIDLWKKQGLTVTQLTATPNGLPGVVDTTIIMTN
jgi:type II secretory pathway component PulM